MKTKIYVCEKCCDIGIPYPCVLTVEKPARKPEFCPYCRTKDGKWKRVKNETA
jgi:rubrerythrin